MKKLNLSGLPKAEDDGNCQEGRIYSEIEEIEVEAETNFRNFKNFDVIEFPPFDHHFLRSKNGANKLFGGSLNRSLRERLVKSGRY